MRKSREEYPDMGAFIDHIDTNGIDGLTLSKLLMRHQGNHDHTAELHRRYNLLENAVPIYSRTPRFGDDGAVINNKIADDFFGEIVDIKTGYFAGRPVTYSYSTTEESRADTGGDMAVEAAAKVLSDFVTRNNMYDVDMETTKLASIAGYAGRLFYIDKDGMERVMALPAYETIVLSHTDITEPQYAVRYYPVTDMGGCVRYKAEFYNDTHIYYFEGASISGMGLVGEPKPHLFDCCPLQGIPNNAEMMGDAERVLDLIDAYDRALSDANNDSEAFSNAYMVFENVCLDEDSMREAQASGVLQFSQADPQLPASVHYLEKNTNDTFLEHHLDRLEGNIYRFSKCPNLSDETFGAASGVSLKFKITGLETKCGMFQAKMQSAGVYMFKLLASSWAKRQQHVEPLQCYMEFKRNFPLDLASEAQSAATLIAAGLPKEIVFAQLSFIDDIDYVMDLIEQEWDGIPQLDDDRLEDDDGQTIPA